MSASPVDIPADTTSMPARAYRTGALVALLRLQWFISLRWAFVLAAFVVLAIERMAMGESCRPWELSVVILGLTLINVVWFVASRLLGARSKDVDVDVAESIRSAHLFANAQVAIDLLLLTLILRYAGGIENPMMLFYVFHITISALLLKKRQAVLQGVWAVLLYAGMAFGGLFGWLGPHYEFLPGVISPGWYADPRFVAVAVTVQACGVFGVMYFALQIAQRLDTKDRQLLAANEALRQSKEAIQDLQDRRARFMQTAAHQLKSPLAIIQTMATLVKDEIVPQDGARAASEKLIQRCREGIAQVTELLTLARVQEADPQRHQQVRTDLGQIVQNLCRKLEPLAVQKDIRLIFRVPKTCDFRAHVDRQDADDCIGNLIENAIKYTPGPGTVHIKVACLTAEQLRQSPMLRVPDARAGYVCVTVRDTGIGIDTSALSGDGAAAGGSIFDAFRRANNALAAGIPGTGLGLSIVREVVEQAGGRLKVHSRLGEGSTFIVMFPAHRDPSAGPPIRDTRASEIILDAGDISDPGEHGG